MTSPYARPDRSALEELEHLLAGVEEELAIWRARALKAEQDVTAAPGASPAKPARASHGGGSAELAQARQRIGILEGENQQLRARIGSAREQIERLRTRLHFVEEHSAGDAA